MFDPSTYTFLLLTLSGIIFTGTILENRGKDGLAALLDLAFWGGVIYLFFSREGGIDGDYLWNESRLVVVIFWAALIFDIYSMFRRHRERKLAKTSST